MPLLATARERRLVAAAARRDLVTLRSAGGLPAATATLRRSPPPSRLDGLASAKLKAAAAGGGRRTSWKMADGSVCLSVLLLQHLVLSLSPPNQPRERGGETGGSCASRSRHSGVGCVCGPLCLPGSPLRERDSCSSLLGRATERERERDIVMHGPWTTWCAGLDLGEGARVIFGLEGFG